METHFSRLSRFGFGLAAALLALTPAVRADPFADLKSLSVFETVDLAQLKGDARAVRGPDLNTPRFQSVQTAWVAPGTPAQVAQSMQRWNPASQSELKIFLHSSGSDFSRLAQGPNNAAVQAFVQETVMKSTNLQISKLEAAKLPASGNGLAGPVASFWSGVLSTRASAGPFGQSPYDYSGPAIRAGDEINSMLRQQPKVQKQFGGIISGKGEQYWELLEVDNKAVVTLGASYSRQSGGGYQTADVLYYASSGYYAAVTLHQMWPVQVDGKPATLVWRVDTISSEEVGGLRGVERLGSEAAMMKDVSKAVRIFRRDSSGSR